MLCVLWHIKHRKLFNAKSSVYINIKYIGSCLIGFYGISSIAGYLMLSLQYSYILNIYDVVWFGLVLWYINQYLLFTAKSYLYIYKIYYW